MNHGFPARAAVAALAILPAACGRQPSGTQPIFVEGRAVTMAGDTLFAITLSGRPDLLVRNRRNGKATLIGAAALHSPSHVQWFENEWYVSDVDNGKAQIVVLAPDGTLRRRIPADQWTDTPHQFAVMPDGRIILEGRGSKLVALKGTVVTPFAVTDAGSKTGLLSAASGGVVHAVPDRYITLYNEFGSIRWRIDWPWAKTAYITDLSVDYNGRIHVIAGVPSQGTFLVYTVSTQTGEVVRWSIPGTRATFTVDPLGKLEPADAGEWLEM